MAGHVLFMVMAEAQGYKQKHAGILGPRLGAGIPLSQVTWPDPKKQGNTPCPGGSSASHMAKAMDKRGLKNQEWELP